MIHVRLTGSPDAPLRQIVRIAIEHVSLDHALSELGVFLARARPARVAFPDDASNRPAALHWESAGTGTLAQQDFDFTVRFDARFGYAISLANGPTLSVTADGSSVQLNQPCAIPLADPIVVQSILGPGLLLALALRGTFALHASAAAFDGRAAVFLGESGAGKSTLAAALGLRSAQGWQRLADDVLPIARGADGALDALPEFPQLKLPADEQYVAVGSRPERVPIASIYVLDTNSGSGAAEPVSITALAPRNALLELIHHTVVGCLFAPDLAARHLDFCAAAATAVPMKRLRYPRRLDAFDAVAEALDADLEA